MSALSYVIFAAFTAIVVVGNELTPTSNDVCGSFNNEPVTSYCTLFFFSRAIAKKKFPTALLAEYKFSLPPPLLFVKTLQISLNYL